MRNKDTELEKSKQKQKKVERKGVHNSKPPKAPPKGLAGRVLQRRRPAISRSLPLVSFLFSVQCLLRPFSGSSYFSRFWQSISVVFKRTVAKSHYRSVNSSITRAIVDLAYFSSKTECQFQQHKVTPHDFISQLSAV